MSKTIRTYPPEFKREAIELALNSLSVAQAAKDLGIPEATLHTWVTKAKQQGGLDAVALQLNQRPRKILAFKTPIDKLQETVAMTD